LDGSSPGGSNVAIGKDAGTALTTGSDNVAVGHSALKTEDANGRNTAVGFEALLTLNAGADGENVAVGYRAGKALTEGIQNTLIGVQAGDALTHADYNVAVGRNALSGDTQGHKSTAVGVGALNVQNFTSSTDTHNTAVGYNAGTAITTGKFNTIVGSAAGDALTTGQYNVAIGYNALTAEDTGSRNTAIGYEALESLDYNGDAYNTAVGFMAGNAVTTGTNNTYIGALVGDANDIGEANVAIGGGSSYAALGADTKGKHSTAVGFGALTAQNFTSDTQTLNTAVGYFAGGVNATGTSNTYIGAFAGDDTNDGNDNVAIGVNALGANCDNTNVAVGNASLLVCTGASNTALGTSAGRQITSGENNTCLGKDAGRSGSPGGAVDTNNNVVCIGDENVANCHIQVDWTIASDERDKTDFQDLDLGLTFVNALNPVTYKWDKRAKYIDKTDVTTFNEDGTVDNEGWDVTADLDAITPDGTHKEDWLDVGFKAQAVIALEEAAGYRNADKTNLITHTSSDGKQLGLQYSKFVPILTKAIQELSAKNDALEAQNTTQATQIADLITRVTALEAE